MRVAMILAAVLALAVPAAAAAQTPGGQTSEDWGSRATQARLLVEQERYAEAEPLLRDLIERIRAEDRSARAPTPGLADALEGLAQLLVETGRGERADALLDQALELRRARSRPGDPDLVATELALVDRRLDQHRWEEAYIAADAVISQATPVLGADHPLVLRAQALKAAAVMDFEGLGEDRWLDATMPLSDALELARTRHPQNHQLEYMLQAAMSEILLRVGQTSEALPMVQNLLDILDTDPLIRGAGERRRQRARLGEMLMRERFLQDSLIFLRDAGEETIEERNSLAGATDLRAALPFKTFVEAAWLRETDPEFGLTSTTELYRYRPCEFIGTCDIQ